MYTNQTGSGEPQNPHNDPAQRGGIDDNNMAQNCAVNDERNFASVSDAPPKHGECIDNVQPIFQEGYNDVLFKRLFDKREDYAYYMKSLWILRDLLTKKIEDENGGQMTTKNPVFPLCDTINEIIGCMLTHRVHVDFFGRAYEVIDGKHAYLPCKQVG